MIKAVFFDWFNTLAKYSPPREELQSKVLGEFGINVSPEKLFPALLIADKELFDKQAELPISRRSPEEQARIYLQHQATILSEIGADTSKDPEMIPVMLKRAREISGGMKFVLYDDVLPTFKTVKDKDLTIGILTNLDSDLSSLCRELGLDPYLDFIVTSGEVGADKPDPEIFMAGLEKAGVEAGNAIHVGDQYKIDIAGAKGAGINPILLDRYGQYPDIKDCPVIKGLSEVIEYI